MSELLTRLLAGLRPERTTYALSAWLFIKILGAIYFIAFASLSVQITGLIGAQGILPAPSYLQAVQANFGATAYWLAPTVFWLNSSDIFLKAVCFGGALLSLLLISGYAQRAILILLFCLYLSLVSVGQDFLSFQWDVLLLEAGFLSIFLGLSPKVIWLFHWLLFRLMFLSGAVKLLSNDPTWRAWTALNYHFATQPLPTPIAWYAAQLPEGLKKFSVAGMFCIELGLPFLIFLPRRLRFLAAGAIVFFQTLIWLTGNYTFFNLLALALCLLLLDDAALRRFFPERLSQAIRTLSTQRHISLFQRRLVAIVAGVIVFTSGFQMVGAFNGIISQPARAVLDWVGPFHIVNSYGLFAVMTTARPEIIIQGSNDGETWLDYEFRYKPGEVRQAPPWVAPHQPRLDWQMWFAALGTYTDNRWFVNLMLRLLQGSPEVLALLKENPFPETPPRYIRAVVYNYTFTDWAERRAEGAWWRREGETIYFPVVSLRKN